jgi:hypothetical protein
MVWSNANGISRGMRGVWASVEMNGLSGLTLRNIYRTYLGLQLEWITGVETNRDGQESKTTHDDTQA